MRGGNISCMAASDHGGVTDGSAQTRSVPFRRTRAFFLARSGFWVSGLRVGRRLWRRLVEPGSVAGRPHVNDAERVKSVHPDFDRQVAPGKHEEFHGLRDVVNDIVLSE